MSRRSAAKGSDGDKKSSSASDDSLYSIILPTYNERDNLPLCVWLIEKYLGDSHRYEVIVVDDASPDKTQEVCKELQKIYGAEKIQLRARPGKLGLGGRKFEKK